MKFLVRQNESFTKKSKERTFILDNKNKQKI